MIIKAAFKQTLISKCSNKGEESLCPSIRKLVIDYIQCNIAGAESHSLIIGAAICGVGLELAILLYTCCVWKAGKPRRGR